MILRFSRECTLNPAFEYSTPPLCNTDGFDPRFPQISLYLVARKKVRATKHSRSCLWTTCRECWGFRPAGRHTLNPHIVRCRPAGRHQTLDRRVSNPVSSICPVPQVRDKAQQEMAMLKMQAYTLSPNPQPHTLNPKPQTLNPRP